VTAITVACTVVVLAGLVALDVHRGHGVPWGTDGPSMGAGFNGWGQQLQCSSVRSIKGHYEWDDDDLTPGQKKEGGLHQNLFDKDGKLKGNARFVPDDGTDSEPLVVTETVYVPLEQRRKTREQEELEQAIAELIVHLIERGIAKAKPVVEQWWQERARPAIDTKWESMWKRSRRLVDRKAGTVMVAVGEPVRDAAQAVAEDRPKMSKAEAQARYLAALAARAYSDEQVRLVMNASIVDGESIAELQRSLTELPSGEVRMLLEEMAKNPSMLNENTLAELASILGRRDRMSPIESRQLRSATEAS
jgi:hypothetical protein